ncbi:MAG: acetyl-CoA hydrolase [Bradyrhizobiaceae bacterium]|nr:acetyl-CoA hydrolase [Bradyrhizobiaceae bacterium]
MNSRGHGPALFEDPNLLADAIIARVGKRIELALPLGLGKANHVVNALFARAAADSSIWLRIFTALTFELPHARNDLQRRFIKPLADRLFHGYPELAYAIAQREGKLPPNIQVDEFFFLAGSRLGIASAQQGYISANYTHALRYVLDRGVNVVAQLVAKRVTNGETRCNLSCNPDITLDLLAERRRGKTDFVFVGQVNSELPFMPGDADIPASEFAYLLEGKQWDFPLFAPPREPVDITEYAAGLHVTRIIPDGGTLQLGIGSLGDAVTKALILRHQHNADFRAIASRLDGMHRAPPSMHEDGPFNIGLYGVSEMLVEGFLDLMRAGVLKREVDGALLHAAFFVGSRAFYRALREMPEPQLAKIRMSAVSFVNELYGDEASKRRARIKGRFINNAMLATLLGAVASDALESGQVVSGVGGQYNFVAQSFALEDARSIIVLRSTREQRGKTVSNIHWSYGHSTVPRHLRDVVATEYGVADLRGKSDRDTIAAMLAVTDSRFQPELLRQAKDAGKIEQSFELPPSARNNVPETISEALAPARAKGLLPSFPFGSDFTEPEQRLLPALNLLRLAPPSRLLRTFFAGIGPGEMPPHIRDCLVRMRLDHPDSVAEWVAAALVRGALRQTPLPPGEISAMGSSGSPAR